MFLRFDGRVAHSNALRLRGDLSQSEIENLRLTSIRDEDVRWLDVPMDDALRMCRVESVGNLNAQIEHRFDLQRLAIDPMPERLPLQQFHGDEGSPIGLVNLVDRADVGMVQRGRGFGLTLKTAESLCVVGELFRKELRSYVATEFQVFRLVDDAHAPAADPAEDAVMGNSLPRGLGRRGHSLHMVGAIRGKVNARVARPICRQVRIGGVASLNPNFLVYLVPTVRCP